MEEPRSWEPNEVKIDPITKAKPTNADLAQGINQVHKCFEDHKEHTSKELKTMRHELQGQSRTLSMVTRSLGLGEDGKPVSGLLSNWQAFWRTVAASTASITTVFVLYKIAIVVGPALWLGIVALNKALRSGLI